MIWRILILLLWPTLVGAQTVTVTTGDHEGFTRLVLDFGSPVDWQVGRTEDGYVLQVPGPRRSYDLTEVFRIIGTTRLAAIWANPGTGALQIGIACACHAIPFEFRPGIVVVDLRDGPPPEGSAFETALDGAVAPVLAERAAPRPKRRPARATVGYDWTSTLVAEPVSPPALPDTLLPLREALLTQMSRGAAQGVVDMTGPAPRRQPTDADPDNVRIGMGELPGLTIGTDGANLTADGAACITGDRIEIGSWGDDSPVAEQMAGALTGMMGEFDRPDPDALARAVRFYLYLGFGAEARQLLDAMPANLPDATLLRSMARIMDEEPDAAPSFSGMAACDSAAALWAVLGQPVPERGSAFDRAAVLRTFSALPIHLRRHLGPALTERLLLLGDATAAQAAQDAVLRAPGGMQPETALTDARLKIAAGDADAATGVLEPIIDSPGPATAEALITLVELQLSQRRSVSGADVTALEAGLQERLGSAEEPRYRKVLILARAAAGDFATAFADLPQAPDAARDLWALVAELAPDSALMVHAVPDADRPVPAEAAAVADRLAVRLADLGFADAAARWLALTVDPDPVLAARISLAQGDAREALRLLAGRDDPQALMLKAEALDRLGDQPARAALLDLADETDAATRARARARDWVWLAATGPEPWQGVAARLDRVPAPPPPADSVAALVAAANRPLAEGRALVDSSAETRAAIDALLAAVAAPAIVGP